MKFKKKKTKRKRRTKRHKLDKMFMEMIIWNNRVKWIILNHLKCN